MNWAFMALPQVQKAFGLDDVVNSIELRLDDIYKSDEVAAAADADHRAEAYGQYLARAKSTSC